MIERVPPQRKVWETTGSPKLLVIGQYRMGFEITSEGNGSLLRVDIDYALPEDAPARWLGSLFGRFYARWCTRQMLAARRKTFCSTVWEVTVVIVLVLFLIKIVKSDVLDE